jgi:hypothetical protein
MCWIGTTLVREEKIEVPAAEHGECFCVTGCSGWEIMFDFMSLVCLVCRGMYYFVKNILLAGLVAAALDKPAVTVAV